MKERWRHVPLWLLLIAAFATIAYGMCHRNSLREGAKLDSIERGIYNLRQTMQSDTDERIIYLKLLYKKRDTERPLARKIASAIYRHAQRTQRDPDLILALALKESDLVPEAVSHMGAIGLIQVMPQWVKVFGDDCNLKDLDCNLRQGLRLLGVYEDLYGNLETALVAYNRGPSPVDWALIEGRNPDKHKYAKDVLEIYNELKEL